MRSSVRVVFVIPVLLAAGAAGGCGALLGIHDVPDATDASSVDAAAIPETSADAADSIDAPRGEASSDGCVPSAEDCTNGRDDDCNGLVDCADPACQSAGFACVPAVPDGWTYAGVDTNGVVACPGGWTADDIVAAASGDPATCSCTCAPQMPSCTHDVVLAGEGFAGCTEVQTSFFADGACHAATAINGYFEATGPGPQGGSCSPQVSKNAPPPSETHWHACTRAAPLGGGCAPNQVCALGPRACIVHDGAQSCPQKGYVEAHAVGTGVSDTRDCGACACGNPTSVSCATGTLTFYTQPNCQQMFTAITTNGACDTHPAGNVASYAYTSTGSATCGSPTQTPAPSGSVTLAGAYTACCVP